MTAATAAARTPRYVTLAMELGDDRELSVAAWEHNMSLGRGSCSFDGPRQDLDASLTELAKGQPSQDHVVDLGLKLGDLLLPGQVRQVVLRIVREGWPLRLRLQFVGAVRSELTALPWELAYVEHVSTHEAEPLLLTYDCSLARHPSDGLSDEPLLARGGELRVFRATCFGPDDGDAAHRAKDDRSLELAVAAVEAPAVRVALGEVHQPRHGLALQRELDRTGRQDVFQFIGHGQVTETGDVALDLGEGSLAADEVAYILEESGVSVAVLCACHSGASTSTGWGGIVPALLAGGLLAVVAMQRRVPESHARAFLAAFYAGLASTGSVDDAVRIARTAISGGKWRLAEWSVPVLYTRHPTDLRVVAAPAAEQVEPPVEAASTASACAAADPAAAPDPGRPRRAPSWVRVPAATATALVTRGDELDAVQVVGQRLARRMLCPEREQRWSVSTERALTSLVLADDGSHLLAVGGGVLEVHRVLVDGTLRPWRRPFPIPEGAELVSCWHAGGGSVRAYLLVGETLVRLRAEDDRRPREPEEISDGVVGACARDQRFLEVDAAGDLQLPVVPEVLRDARWCDVDRARSRHGALTAAVGDDPEQGSVLLVVREEPASRSARWLALSGRATGVTVARAADAVPYAAAVQDDTRRWTAYRWCDLPDDEHGAR